MASASGTPFVAGDGGDVGAEHHELAVGEVDHAHHAEDDGQSDGGQQQEREADLELVEGVEDAVKTGPPAGVRVIGCSG